MKLREIANAKKLTHEQIDWLITCVKGKWNLNADGLVDVIGDVILPFGATNVPVGFANVSGIFRCYNTKITSLAGAPRSVGGNFYCHNAKITSLAGAPHSVGGDFSCYNTGITSLAGAPQRVGRNFYCQNTGITSLEGAPKSVGGDFHCSNENITSLEGAPRSIGGSFYCHNTPLLNHLLAFFRAPAIKSVKTGNDAIDAILNKYLASADRDMLLCQDELIDAGFGDKARL